MAEFLRITSFRWLRRQHLLASFDLEIGPWHLQLCGLTWHRWQTAAGEKVMYPAKEYVGGDGKKKYATVLKWTDKAVEARFQRAVLQLLHQVPTE